MTEAEKIAAGLTDVQKRALRSGIAWSGATRNALIRQGLCPAKCPGRRRLGTPGEPWRWPVPRTPLGEQVAAHIRKERGE